jgi:hypothetical protein
MRVLFALQHPGYVRNYESTIRMLAQRGHVIHLAFTEPWKQADEGVHERLTSEFPNVTTGRAPLRTDDQWAGVAWAMRLVMDYVRYLHPRYRGAEKLRERMGHKAEVFLRVLQRVPLLRSAPGVRLIVGVLQGLERAVPSSKMLDDFVRSHRPDVVLVTPLVNVASSQVEYLKSAQALGIRTGVCVASWDNLTNKGLIRVQPDRIFVWNQTQKTEAVELHRMRPDSIVVTGAQRFDEWFDQQPSRSYKAFCREVGLEASKPYLLFVGSSSFIAPDEVSFVRNWVSAIRGAQDERVKSLGILVRPHPKNAEQWQQADFSEFENVTVWPRAGAQPVTADSKADFFDSLYHSQAVVGINTSALIEAGIVGRPVLTVLAPEFSGTQRGTLHFGYLEQVGGGLLHVATSFEEHLAQIVRLATDVDGAQVNRRFIGEFVRPHGLDVPCTPILVDGIEALAALGAPRPARAPIWSTPVRVALLGLRLVFKGYFNQAAASRA